MDAFRFLSLSVIAHTFPTAKQLTNIFLVFYNILIPFDIESTLRLLFEF